MLQILKTIVSGYMIRFIIENIFFVFLKKLPSLTGKAKFNDIRLKLATYSVFKGELRFF